TPIGYFWARTVPSPNPASASAPTPLLSTFWLSKVKGKEAFLDLQVSDGRVHLGIRPHAPPPSDVDTVAAGAKIGRGKFKCLLTGVPIPPSHVKASGRDASMAAMHTATVIDSQDGRCYLPARWTPQP